MYMYMCVYIYIYIYIGNMLVNMYFSSGAPFLGTARLWRDYNFYSTYNFHDYNFYSTTITSTF